MNNRLITPELRKAFANYPLYSQDGKQRDAVCVCAFELGNISWYILEGEEEGGDFTFFGIVTGMYETEYGYVSANELAEINERGWVVQQNPRIRDIPLWQIRDHLLQEFLSRLYYKSEQ